MYLCICTALHATRELYFGMSFPVARWPLWAALTCAIALWTLRARPGTSWGITPLPSSGLKAEQTLRLVCLSFACCVQQELSASSGCTAKQCSCIVREREMGANHRFVTFSLHPRWWLSPGCREPAGVLINVRHCSFHFWHQRYTQALVQ